MKRLGIIIFCALLARGAVHAAPPADVFSTADLAPPDATIFLHFEDVASLQRDLKGRPIVRWLGPLLGDEEGDLRRAWIDLSRRAKADPEALWRHWLGRRITFIGRGGGRLIEAEWAVVTEVDPAQADRIEKALRPRLRGLRSRVAISELPEHALLLARQDELMVIGSTARPALFHDVVDRIAARADDAPRPASLAGHVGVNRGRTLGTGRAGAVLRHAAPMGGWSVAVADLDAGRVRIRHSAAFDSPPFSRSVTRLDCDCAPLSELEEHTLLAFLEPTDGGDGPIGSFVEMSIGAPLLSAPMRRNLGERRIIAMGESEGRLLERPVDVLSTSVAVCLELKDGDGAIEAIDEHMVDLATRLRDQSRGAFLVEVDRFGRTGAADGREIDISPATDWFTGGFPVMRNIRLNWTVAEGPHGAWCVIATDRGHLEEVAESLGRGRPGGDAMTGRFDSVGTAAGRRIGRHLVSWIDQAHLFAAEEDIDSFRDALGLVSACASGVDRCRWRLNRPCARTMDLQVELILSPPDSAAPAAP